MQPNLLVVPVFKFYSYDLGRQTNVGGTITSFDNSLKGWQLGAAGNWTLGSNDLFVLGMTFANNSYSTQQDLFGLTAGAPRLTASAPKRTSRRRSTRSSSRRSRPT